jgi:hypothetical protein
VGVLAVYGVATVVDADFVAEMFRLKHKGIFQSIHFLKVEKIHELSSK